MRYSYIANGILGLGLIGTSILSMNQYKEIESNQQQIKQLDELIVKKNKDIDQLNTINTTYEKAIKSYKKQVNKYKINIENKDKKINKLNKKLHKTESELHNKKLKLKRESSVRQGKVVSKSASNSNSNWQTFNVSFYTNHQQSTGKSYGDEGYGLTASGTHTAEGRTIACPRQYSFGTKIELEGLGIRVCEDTGSAIVGNNLDVYVQSESEAMRLGRKQLKGRILK